MMDSRRKQWESVCRRCGRCCHHKIRFGDAVVISDLPCDYLDPVTNLCTVYPERYARQPLCSSAEISADIGVLPDDCPYVGGRSNYAAPLLLEEHPEYEADVNALFPERAAKTALRTPSAAQLGRMMEKRQK